MSKDLRVARTVFLLVIVIFCIASALTGSCRDKKKGENGQANTPPALDSRIEEYFQKSFAKWMSGYRKDFFWMTPTSIASESLRVERTKLVDALGADYNMFMEWAGKQESDPLAKDLVQLAADPFEMYEASATDKLDLARLYYSLGMEKELKALVFPPPETPAEVADENAADASEEAVSTGPADPNLLAVWLLYRTQFFGLDEDVTELAKLDADSSSLKPEIAYAVRIRMAIELGAKSKPADEIVQYLSPIAKSDDELLLILGRVLWRSGRYNDADAALSNYVNQYDEHPIAWLTRGEVYIDMGQPTKGREYILKGYALNGYMGESMVALGATFNFEGRFEEALRHYENCYDIDQLEPSLYPRWARLLLDLGRNAEARDRIERGVTLFPRNPEARVISGRIYFNEEDYENAYKEYEEAGRIAPKMPFVQIELGKIALLKGDELGAATCFDKALSLGASPSEVESEWGRTYLHIEDYEKARVHLKKASELTPNDAGIHKALAKALETLGSIKEAAEEYAKAGSLDTWDGDSCVKAALMYAKQGNIDMSLKWLDNAAAAKWIDTDYIVDNFPPEVQARPEFKNILSNMNPSFGM